MKWRLLSLFTIGEAISVGFLSSFYTFQSVVSAMGATALASLTVSAYTILNQNAKYDLSQWGAGLSS
jgi:FtsH-binding integral membrane protein